MLFHAKEFTVSIGDSHCDCIRFGNGPKTMLMIQGLNTRGIKGAALPLAYMYRIFTKDYTVYLFDRRVDLPESVTVRELAEDVAAAMDQLGFRKADILGVSQGGMIAQYLAVKMYSEAYIRRYRPFMKLLTLLQSPQDVPRFLVLAKACLTCETYEQLDKIQCPVLVIGGRQDQVVSGEASVEMAEKLACQFYIYEDLGHAAYEEAKDFNQKVLNFFRMESR